MWVEKILSLKDIRQDFEERMISKTRFLRSISKSTFYLSNKSKRLLRTKSKSNEWTTKERFKKWWRRTELKRWRQSKITRISFRSRSKQKSLLISLSGMRSEFKANTCWTKPSSFKSKINSIDLKNYSIKSNTNKCLTIKRKFMCENLKRHSNHMKVRSEYFELLCMNKQCNPEKLILQLTSPTSMNFKRTETFFQKQIQSQHL